MSRIPFSNQTTGVRVVRTDYSGNNMTKKIETETEVLSALRFLEPVPASYRKQLIDAFGEQNGQYYILYLEREDALLKADISKYTIFWDGEKEKQNEQYTNFTKQSGLTNPGSGSIKAKIINIIDGGLTIDQRQVILATFN